MPLAHHQMASERKDMLKLALSEDYLNLCEQEVILEVILLKLVKGLRQSIQCIKVYLSENQTNNLVPLSLDLV